MTWLEMIAIGWVLAVAAAVIGLAVGSGIRAILLRYRRRRFTARNEFAWWINRGAWKL